MIDGSLTWKTVDLSGDPLLILGRRKGRTEIDTASVSAHRNLFPTLREVGHRALDRLNTRSPKDYHPHAALDTEDEYFLIPNEAIPNRPIKNKSMNEDPQSENNPDDEENPDRTASLIQSLENPFTLDQLDAKEIGKFKAFFYSISFPQKEGKWVHFVNKSNPRQVFKPGRVWTQFTSDLKAVATPDLLLEPDCDVVLTKDFVAGFNSYYIRSLFTDVRIMMMHVNSCVDRIREKLISSVPLGNTAYTSLIELAEKQVSIASRLYQLEERMPEINLTADQVRRLLTSHKFDPSSILGENEFFNFDQKGVKIFLDLVEGRYFEDDWTGELRRADRYSKRG